jgi:hypothetical protein
MRRPTGKRKKDSNPPNPIPIPSPPKITTSRTVKTTNQQIANFLTQPHGSRGVDIPSMVG